MGPTPLTDRARGSRGSPVAARPAGARLPRVARRSRRTRCPSRAGRRGRGATRVGHSPSRYAIDWNRNPDLGAPVVAAAAGVVTTAQATPSGGYGRWVVVDHGNGETSLYAHLASVVVALGQRVDQGAMIGTLGDSGNSSGRTCTSRRRSAAAWSRPC